jgi:hypothetical protein
MEVQLCILADAAASAAAPVGRHMLPPCRTGGWLRLELALSLHHAHAALSACIAQSIHRWMQPVRPKVAAACTRGCDVAPSVAPLLLWPPCEGRAATAAAALWHQHCRSQVSGVCSLALGAGWRLHEGAAPSSRCQRQRAAMCCCQLL